MKLSSSFIYCTMTTFLSVIRLFKNRKDRVSPIINKLYIWLDENDRRIFFYQTRVLFHFMMIYYIKINNETRELHNMYTSRYETRTVINSSFMKLSKQTSCCITDKWESEFMYENQVLPTANRTYNLCVNIIMII